MPVIEFLEEIAAKAASSRRPEHNAFDAVIYLFYDDQQAFHRLYDSIHDITRCHGGCIKCENLRHLFEEAIYVCHLVYEEMKTPNEVSILQCIQVVHYVVTQVWEQNHVWTFKSYLEASDLIDGIHSCCEISAKLTFQQQRNFSGWKVRRTSLEISLLNVINISALSMRSTVR